MIIKMLKKECYKCGSLVLGYPFYKCHCGDCPAVLYEVEHGKPWVPKKKERRRKK
jgi:hypothetical protein